MIRFKCTHCKRVFKGKDEYEAENKFNAHNCIPKNTPLYNVKLSSESKIVTSLQEAILICLQDIEKNKIKKSEWKEGQIQEPIKGTIGRVSYEGKIYDNKGKEIIP